MRRARMMNAGMGGILLWAALTPGAAAESTPRQVVARFDSLMEAGTAADLEAARALTIDQARRLFPLLASAQSKVAPLLDTARTRDTILDEKISASWAAIKVRAVAVFRVPVLGMDSLASVQAVHLYRSGGNARRAPGAEVPGDSGWRIASFEEIGEGDALVLRTGVPADAGTDADTASRAPLPLSRLAPENADMPRITRLRLRVSSRGSSEALPPLPVGPGQRIMTRNVRGEGFVDIETRVPAIGDSLSLTDWDDSLDVYRASTEDLDLTDKKLRTLAARLKQGSPHALETARRIRRHVSENFEYKLGATLFAGSREALRAGRGDCSEAAILVAALLRAAGIPSRVVLGYATLQDGVWIGHAWAEAYLGGAWVGVDAALREFPAGATRLALVTLDGSRPMQAEATNLMLRTLADLDVQITGAWSGDSALPLVEHPGAARSARAFWDQVMEGLSR